MIPDLHEAAWHQPTGGVLPYLEEPLLKNFTEKNQSQLPKLLYCT